MAIKLDWKAPSEKVMKEYVGKLDNEKKKSFAKACMEVKDGKNVVNKSKARNWLVENCPKEDIEWKNKPKTVRGLSSADEIASWLDL